MKILAIVALLITGVVGTQVAPQLGNGSGPAAPRTVASGEREVVGAPGTQWNAPLPVITSTPSCPPRPGPAAPRGARHVGIAYSPYFIDESACDAMTRIRRAGATMIRSDLDWSAVERSPGQFDWRRYDAMVLLAAEHGLTFLPVIDRTPGWTGKPRSAIPAQPAAYARFVGLVAARYGPGGTFWKTHQALERFAPTYFEIWNEPFYSFFSNLHPSAAVYARLFRAAAVAGRRANPRAKFLLAAELSYWVPSRHKAYDWIAGMYRAVPDLNRYFDAVAVHPYSYNATPPRTAYSLRRPTLSLTSRVEAIEREFQRRGAAQVPLWITEIGWPTCSGVSKCVSEAQQARYIRQLARLEIERWPYIRATMVFTLGDNQALSPEGHYGLLRRDTSQKPAWNAFRALAAQLQR